VVVAIAERDFDGVGEEGKERECAREEEEEMHDAGGGLAIASKDCGYPG